MMELLSTFAMKVNARQYTEVADVWCAGVEAGEYVAFLARTMATVQAQYAGTALHPSTSQLNLRRF